MFKSLVIVLVALFCILDVQGGPQCKGPHEFLKCVQPSCPVLTCADVGKGHPCPCPGGPGCQIRCVCDSYSPYRSSSGECYDADECKRCTGPHEYFACGGACDNICATLHEQSQENCPIRNIKCNDMCYCEQGHARNEEGVCVPIENCNQPQA